MRKYNQLARIFFILLTLLGINLKGAAQATTPPDDPRGLTIYQIMVASFQHGDGGAPGYTAMWGPDNARKDGNLRGIINAVDFIDSLGVNAVWLTPIFDSTKALYDDPKLNATGYFTNDYFTIDPNFGTDADLRELIDKLHRRGIYVILDGVFGHHGGVTTPSPMGHSVDNTPSTDCRGYGTPLSYPGSLDYYIDVATYWIDNYGIDGWRLDQAYQACQGGHNYWIELRQAVEDLAARRAARGEKWGTLGYMVGEDWGPADVINNGVYKDGGLISAFDFDGNDRLVKLADPFTDIPLLYSSPTARGYLNDSVMPNLFLSNHDVYRVGDKIERDSTYFDRLKMRNAVLAAYPGPITLYYGDEFGDDTRDAIGAQPDNIARTSGHIEARSADEADLRSYVASVMKLRKEHPAMWRGDSSFETIGDKALKMTRTDAASGETIIAWFPLADIDVDVPAGSTDLLTGQELSAPGLSLKANVPAFILINQ
ncbi:MAG: hypothetical protein K2M80_05310 [Muribaculaceae bacterium]|nr:hypothetical protein [Muribaculaceae bacterium]